MVNQGVNLGFAFAHFVTCVAHIISYRFIVNTFDTSKCLYHIIKFDSASGAICSFTNFVMNVASWYFEIVGSSIWCSFWILTGPLRILLGPVFSITGAVIRYNVSKLNSIFSEQVTFSFNCVLLNFFY